MNSSNDWAQFIVEEHGQRVYLYTEVGESSVQTGARVGKRGALHTSAAGKAILANLPESRVEEIIEQRGLEAGTENTISSREDLFEELERIREQGYALNNRETNIRVNAVGTAVMNADGTVLGALSVAGPGDEVEGQDMVMNIPLDHVLDVRVDPGRRVRLPLTDGWTSVVVVLHGTVLVNDDQVVRAAQAVQLAQSGDSVVIESNTDATLLVLDGQPIGEPVVGYGPFVMNTQEEIRQALSDFKSGRFGRLAG